MTTAIQKRKSILENEIKRITNLIIQKYFPEKIILFGSAVKGNIHQWSDIDLVLIKKTDKRFIDRLHEVHLLTRPSVGVNFIVYTPEEAQRMIEENRYFFVKEIINKGKVLYAKPK